LNIIDQNIYADNLVTAFQGRNPLIHGIVIRSMTNKSPESQKLSLDDENGTRHYDLFAFPVNNSDNNKTNVLLFGKDTINMYDLKTEMNDFLNERFVHCDLCGKEIKKNDSHYLSFCDECYRKTGGEDE
jgi:hypothetical protein